MTKHDTWVKLKPGNPFEPIMHLFADSMMPMRDPFPIELSADAKASLWIIDLERLKSSQATAITQLIATNCGVNPIEVQTAAMNKGGFAMNYQWVESMQCGNEGFQRQRELVEFLETAPEPSPQAWAEFINGQIERWIEGNEQAPPINSIEDVHPSLRTPELELSLKMRKIETAIAIGDYSVFDVLTGRATVNVLNIIDPENSYSLVGDDDEYEDDEIYE